MRCQKSKSPPPQGRILRRCGASSFTKGAKGETKAQMHPCPTACCGGNRNHPPPHEPSPPHFSSFIIHFSFHRALVAVVAVGAPCLRCRGGGGLHGHPGSAPLGTRGVPTPDSASCLPDTPIAACTPRSGRRLPECRATSRRACLRSPLPMPRIHPAFACW